MTISQLKIILLGLLIVGITVPYYFLIAYIVANGFNAGDIYTEIVSTRLSIFAWVDVIISAVTLLLFMFSTKLISGKQSILVMLLTVTVGVSAGLPLLLYYLVGSGNIKFNAR